MKNFALHLYLSAVFEVVAKANRYFANSEPWRLARNAKLACEHDVKPDLTLEVGVE